MTLSRAIGKPARLPRSNNFDLLRFLFAVFVFFAHTYQLSRTPELSWLTQIFSASTAVQCFFVVSGFLIFMSFENSESLGQYFDKRVRRIYPAYFTVVTLCALLGVLLSALPWQIYFTSSEFYQYLIANLFFLNFLQPDLPGVFDANHLSAVNGALWTLKIEVMFYLSVPVIVWFLRRIGLWQGLLALYVLSAIYSYVIGIIAMERGGLFVELQRQLPGQLMYFIAGGALYYFFEQFKANASKLFLIAIIGLVIENALNLGILHAFSLGVVVIYLAYALPYLGNFGKYGDFSYGVYILHFPVLQTLIALGLFAVSPFVGFVFAGIVTLSLAYLLWHWIEKPALRPGSHYVRASHG